MVRLVSRSDVRRAPVYDVTIADTHSFFAARGPTPINAVLAHNCHQLSKDALDALLKPLEDEEVGSGNKKLVCIFCTTEPEKVRKTILSRSTVFRVRAAAPEAIANRLAFICGEEGIEFDASLLQYIAEVTECHVRDAIKAVEGISQLGPIDKDNVTAFLQLDLNHLYVQVLANLGHDLPETLSTAETILERVSPLTVYRRMSEVALMAFKLSLGITKLDQFWDREAVEGLSKIHGQFLVTIAQTFAERPGRPSGAMLLCDLAQLHYGPENRPSRPIQAAPLPPNPSPPAESPPAPPDPTSAPAAVTQSRAIVSVGVNSPEDLGTVDQTPRLLNGGVYQDIRLIRKRRRAGNGEGVESSPSELNPAEFSRILRMTISEQDRAKQRRGSAGQRHMDRG